MLDIKALRGNADTSLSPPNGGDGAITTAAGSLPGSFNHGGILLITSPCHAETAMSPALIQSLMKSRKDLHHLQRDLSPSKRLMFSYEMGNGRFEDLLPF